MSLILIDNEDGYLMFQQIITIELNDGQTLALGGLIKNQDQVQPKIPFQEVFHQQRSDSPEKCGKI